MCYTPVTITKDREYWTPDGHTGGVTEVVPCGKCPKCRQRRALAWVFRLSEHMKDVKSAKFLTLTYEISQVPTTQNGFLTLRKEDVQKFLKRLRKVNRGRIKYYLAGEYGTTTFRPHYHAIIFDLDHALLSVPDRIAGIWKHGHIRLDPCTVETIAYTTGYVNKPPQDPDHCRETGLMDDRIREFSLMSKGLGARYCSDAMIRYHKQTMTGLHIHPGGRIQALPRYYRERIFTSEERAILAADAKEYHELNIQDRFDSAIKEVEWKKDQYRKQDKNLRLKRAKL